MRNRKFLEIFLRLFVVALLVAIMQASELVPSEGPGGPSFDEKAVADFYGGRTVTIVVGFAAGGGYDITSRVIARHLGKHIPGNPTVIVENRPGAGSLVAGNLVYKTLRKDGTYIVNFHPQLMLQQLLGREGIEFDGRQYNWLGSASTSQNACGVRVETGINHWKQITGPGGKVVTMGGEAPGSGITDTAAVMRAALDLNFRIIYGYAGAKPIANAVLNRELDGFCISWESFTSDNKIFFTPKKLLNMLVIFGSELPEHPWLKGAVAVEKVAPSEEARRLARIVYAPGKISFPYAVAPEVPADRLAALRRAFDKTFSDAAFITDFNKTGRPLVGRSGDEVAETVRELLETRPGTIATLKEALKQREGP